MKKNVLLSILIFKVVISSAQSTIQQNRIYLENNHKVYKLVSIPNCPQIYNAPAGAITNKITNKTKYQNGKTEIEVESISNPFTSSFTLNTDKALKIPLFPNSRGWASLYLDDKDKSVLYVNYFLNSTNVVDSGFIVEKQVIAFSCAGVVTFTPQPRDTLVQDTEFLLEIVEITSSNVTNQWFLNSERINVYNSSGVLQYYLVNHYDRDAKYMLDLKNREHITYNQYSIDFAAITIPLKYRFKHKEIPSDASASFNVGAYFGYKLTRFSIINLEGTYTNRNYFSLRLGPFFNLSTVTLDSLTTTSGENPFKKDDKQNIALFSTGIGLMVDLKGFQIGVYGGSDYGFGSEAKNWNYNKRIWLGLGLGYKITDFFAQKS